MPKPKISSRVRRSCARFVRGAAALSIAALVVWPVGVGASDFTGVLPPPPERLKDTIDRTLDDSSAGLRKSIESGREVVDEVNAVVQDVLGGEVAPADHGPAPESRTELAAKRRRDEREVQAGDGARGRRGDVDELVASGDDIGRTRVRASQAAQPKAEALPFTGFDPARLLLAGVTMILSGVALLNSAREGHARRRCIA